MPLLRVVPVAVVLACLLGGTAQAAPVGGLKQYKVPTADSQPRAIVNGSDGNRWFTLGTEFTNAPPAIARITPSGAVTEFRPPCETCIVTDIVQGPDGILYFSSNEAFLGRITTAGTFLAPIPTPNSNALAGDLAVHGSQVWMTDFNNDALWRYDIPTGAFTRFDVPEPSDVVVDAAGIVWFAAPLESAIGRLDPQSGVVTLDTDRARPAPARDRGGRADLVHRALHAAGRRAPRPRHEPAGRVPADQRRPAGHRRLARRLGLVHPDDQGQRRADHQRRDDHRGQGRQGQRAVRDHRRSPTATPGTRCSPPTRSRSSSCASRRRGRRRRRTAPGWSSCA